uniref:Ankyrin repeat and EF-hand domain containing 1a n=1 Tax=Sinocyclocheilus anshuiensis TaxID=1608454 RepID=A0A671Q1K8_9TELE
MMSCTLAKGRFEVLQIYRLLQCVQNGDKPYIEKLISMVANKPDMLGFLIAQGVRPDMQDRRGRTPLMLDAELGYDGIVSLLAKNNAHMKLVHKEGKVSVIIRTLASLSGLLFNALDKKRFHAAHFASERGFFDVSITFVLSAYAADFGVVTSEGDTLLHFAASGCNPKLKNQEGLLPRQIAKDYGHKATVKELKKAERLHGKFSKGAGATNEPWALTLHDWLHENENALRSAFESASEGYMGIEMLEKIYINMNYCVKTGDIESLRLALSQKVPVDVKDRFYKTPLMAACASGNYEVAKFLLDNRADVNACDQFSWTSLHHAGQLDIIQLLLEMGASVDPSTLNRATPLMRAIESCRPSCVEYLIKAGVKVNAVNKKQRTIIILLIMQHLDRS